MLNEAGSNLLPNWLVSHSGASPGLVETCKTSKTEREVLVPREREVASCYFLTDPHPSCPPFFFFSLLPSLSRKSFAEVCIPKKQRSPGELAGNPSQYRPAQGAQRWLSPSSEELWMMKQRGDGDMKHIGGELRVEPRQRKVRVSPSMSNGGGVGPGGGWLLRRS